MIRCTITCDVCGKTEDWPYGQKMGDRNDWVEFWDFGPRRLHVCSTECGLAYGESRNPTRNPTTSIPE